METNYKPQNYNSLSPYFIVSDARKFLNLMESIFDVQALRRFEREDGSIMHVELRIDDSVIMLSEATSEYPANKFLIHVYVPDVQKVFKRAIEAGCEVVEEPVNKEGDPDLRGSFRDFAGNEWAVSTQLL